MSTGYLEHCREADLAGAHMASCLEKGGGDSGQATNAGELSTCMELS